MAFEGTDEQGNPHPPEWQPETNLSHGDPEADHKIFNHPKHNAKRQTELKHTTRGGNVDVIPDHMMEEDTEHIPCTVCKQAEVQATKRYGGL